MCLGVPVKVSSIEESRCIGEVNGIVMEFCGDYIGDLKVGDNVVVHAGFAIEKLTDETYMEIKRLLSEMAERMGDVEEESWT